MRDEADHPAAPPLPEVRLRLDRALSLAGIGAWECELAAERLTWTSGVYDIFGYPAGNPLRRADIVALYVDESRRNMELARAEVIRTGRAIALDAEIRTWRGETRWMRLTINSDGGVGQPARIFGSKQDVTSDRQAMDSLRRQAETDPLTGLANRAVFQTRYREITGDNLNHGFATALALVDLDRFKELNDTFGHPAGDACLCEIAQRLRQAFCGVGLVSRLGGDEFALILRAPVNPARIARVLQEAVVMLSRPFFWNGMRLEVGASIGVALVGRPHRRRITELFAEADMALYDAKAAGCNKVYLFGDEGQSRAA
ncbi:sensor domain-containing diguanylate cyclase [Bradyrhizobium sp. U87765 SZCCT0131]|nr:MULTISPECIES: sensor domain-containing diguanylate cyclase [unclassified Bradyrhizobium]MBR1221578.1 sensor domain-containing diguanylate cyclase [Bradyrhizobium sp. U87765 SZCCT0131]MBR1264499.1 sensor domain-containing diguanylate cyclase [Bradyrhizobium sp. U87765 SZCCT0134]MBR1304594.1 sensor domain-containing diguanylate cyclase [Bradyrhizobium sp. U87765 SZCCT0110]MBR1322549.1 sensor domain-containing diguanylate cyclase [Bradyrhizobium sp. U87765 SZCCT0109]MBR1346523.1 sensor domain-